MKDEMRRYKEVIQSLSHAHSRRSVDSCLNDYTGERTTSHCNVPGCSSA